MVSIFPLKITFAQSTQSPFKALRGVGFPGGLGMYALLEWTIRALSAPLAILTETLLLLLLKVGLLGHLIRSNKADLWDKLKCAKKWGVRMKSLLVKTKEKIRWKSNAYKSIRRMKTTIQTVCIATQFLWRSMTQIFEFSTCLSILSKTL